MSKTRKTYPTNCPITGKSPGGNSCKCVFCKQERARVQREYRKANPDYVRKMNLWTQFRITPDEFQDILEEQGYVCAVCKKPQRGHNQYGNNSLCVDHNHETGQIRGLLCNHCNRALGFLEDNIDTIEALLNYRKKYDD